MHGVKGEGSQFFHLSVIEKHHLCIGYTYVTYMFTRKLSTLFSILALLGALIVMMCYYISAAAANFSDLHSINAFGVTRVLLIFAN